LDGRHKSHLLEGRPKDENQNEEVIEEDVDENAMGEEDVVEIAMEEEDVGALEDIFVAPVGDLDDLILDHELHNLVQDGAVQDGAVQLI
jgi:hypothetical protein